MDYFDNPPFEEEEEEIFDEPFGVVGREQELQDLIQALEKHPQVVLQSPSGLGKSVLAIELVQAWLNEGQIRVCRGVWGSPMVLAAKPHQEECYSIKEFIWHACVN